ncbi:MAG: MmgE/PrpD family protein [Deltaproteobacteria bacterium]|jgi:2-methylcitrate dehydratase PrpD|nr:MmgE/PrpD family protein [Deltaproteobacteria bacterium]MBW2480680.1 MmgE/PrpD family protein [Deltaproteobacteria bacterium]
MTKTDRKITDEVVAFVAQTAFSDFPAEAIRIAQRCVLDGLGLMLAGSAQDCTRIVREFSCKSCQGSGATAFGKDSVMLPPALAALVNGTAGHAMDWDDTQLSTSPDRTFGLLTHPTIPPLAAALAVTEMLGGVSGREFITAFLTGFEVECKIAESIRPEHYEKGFHSSGTVGTFGAAVAVAKLIGLDHPQLRHLLGMTASMASGIRANFGTMTKPLHVGRAAQNGVTAALLAQGGYEADPDGLDGPWGFFEVFGRGADAERIIDKLGRPHSIVEPGVSVKPYPCGSLTHPSMDAMRTIVIENDLKPDDIQEVILYAGNNILHPIRYTTAENELQAKFCMPFLLAAIVISRKAGVQEFTHGFVHSQEVRSLMQKIRTEFDPVIEAKGYDKMRSRVEVTLNNGSRIVRDADDRYRGGPENPLSDDELKEKFADCSQSMISDSTRDEVVKTVFELDSLSNMDSLIERLSEKPAVSCRPGDDYF